MFKKLGVIMGITTLILLACGLYISYQDTIYYGTSSIVFNPDSELIPKPNAVVLSNKDNYNNFKQKLIYLDGSYYRVSSDDGNRLFLNDGSYIEHSANYQVVDRQLVGVSSLHLFIYEYRWYLFAVIMVISLLLVYDLYISLKYRNKLITKAMVDNYYQALIDKEDNNYLNLMQSGIKLNKYMVKDLKSLSSVVLSKTETISIRIKDKGKTELIVDILLPYSDELDYLLKHDVEQYLVNCFYISNYQLSKQQIAFQLKIFTQK